MADFLPVVQNFFEYIMKNEEIFKTNKKDSGDCLREVIS